IVAVVILHEGVGDTAVEVEAVAIGRAVGVVAVGLAVLDGDGVGVPGPDSDRAAIVSVGLPVVVGDAMVDGATLHIGENDSVADVVGGICVPGVVVDRVVSERDAAVGVRGGGSGKDAVGFDAADDVIVGNGVGDADIAEAGFSVASADGD